MGVSGGFQVDQITLSGVIQMYGGSSAPPGWILCDGSAVSRSTYSTLFGIIGTTYGAGDGSTTFNLPDMRGRVPVMKSADSEFTNMGQKGGEKQHTLSTAEMPAHAHGISYNNGMGIGLNGGNPTTGQAYNLTWNNDGWREIAADNTGGGGSHNNLQPYFTIQFIIKL